MENLRISTITSVMNVSSPIDLKAIYDGIPISEHIPFNKYGAKNVTRRI